MFSPSRNSTHILVSGKAFHQTLNLSTTRILDSGIMRLRIHHLHTILMREVGIWHLTIIAKSIILTTKAGKQRLQIRSHSTIHMKEVGNIHVNVNYFIADQNKLLKKLERIVSSLSSFIS